MGKKLFVGGLPFATTSDKLEELFSEVGKVESAVVITDRTTGNSRGFGFVEMVNDEEAKSAVEKFNGYSLEGRTLAVSEARPRPERPRFERPQGRKSFR